MAYTISKNKLEYYARIIQKLQHELGLSIASFYELNLFPLKKEGFSQEEIDRHYDIEYVTRQKVEVL